MSKRERKKQVREARKMAWLKIWREEKSQGLSTSAFLVKYGFDRKTFYRWLKEEKVDVKPFPIRRVPDYLRQKVLEIYCRYRGTWDSKTISICLKGMISPWTVRAIIREVSQNSVRKEKAVSFDEIASPEARNDRVDRPNEIWAFDWTEIKLPDGGKIYLAVLMDEASRFRVGWRFLERVTTENLIGFLEDALARYSVRPSIIRTDNAPQFKSPVWKIFLESQRIKPVFIPPYSPQSQGRIERGMRETKSWLRVFTLKTIQDLEKALDEGMFMLNFLKPKEVLGGRTPAQNYFVEDVGRLPWEGKIKDGKRVIA